MGLKSVQRTIKDVCINLEKNEEYKEMKKENNYISTDMNHKKLIVGVVIIHVCFMLIGASGIISTLKEKNGFNNFRHICTVQTFRDLFKESCH